MDPLEQLGREVRRSLGEGPGPERRRRQRRAVARLTTSSQEHVSLRMWMVPLLAFAGALAALWFARPAPAPAPLAAHVGDRPFAAGAWLSAGADPLTLELAGPAQVVFTPQTAARLVRADDSEVALSLERGQLELAVTPDPQRRWSVAAGPFTVEVTGTIFTVEWQPQARTLAVAVHEGQVRVRGGPLPPEGNTVGAAQRFEIHDAAPTTTHEPELAPEPVASPTSRASREEPAWRRLAVAGDHAGALAAVERAGLAAVLTRADAEDLDRLAHSARIAGRSEIARAALQTLRRRFPRDARARTAAFLLGRVALEQDRDPGAAAEWFERYVQEQPSGPLVEEARGRILEVRREQGDPGRVQAAARAYLEHHPDGSRARLARALLDPP